MTFLNATLMFGLAAIAVPIALHMLARREPRKVVFPSVRFLTKKFESNRNRLRIRKWWLLALRVAALAALATALARPAIHRSLSLTWLTIGLLAAVGIGLLVMATVAIAKSNSKATSYGLGGAALLILLGVGLWGAYTTTSGPAMSIDQAQPVAIAIVMDNSPTSAWNRSGDDRMTRMQDLANWMVTRLPRTSRIAIIDRSAQAATFSLDVGSAVSRIEAIRPLEVAQPLASRLEVAARLVRTSDLEQRRVLLISDLAKSTWQDVAEKTELTATFQSDPAVALTIFDLGDFSGLNRSLSIPRFADSSPPRGEPVRLSSTLQVAGGDGARGEGAAEVSVTVDLDLYQNDPSLPVVRDGAVKLPEMRSVDRTTVKVAPGNAQEVLLTIPSLDVGMHHGRLRMTGDDAMPLDDVRHFSIQVLPPSPVLLVGDDEDEANIIREAIAVSEDAETAYVVERIAYQDLAVVRLEDFEALVMLDPPRDTIQDAAVLEYVNSGGGVLLCLGPAAGDAGLESPLLPSLVRRWRSPDPGTFFQVTGSKHPVTEPLSADTPWSDFRIHQYWQLAPAANDNVLIQYAGTTHAALVERSFTSSPNQTAGHVIVMTTPVPSLGATTRKWNDLFTTNQWPAWLLTRKCVEHLTGRGAIDLMSPVGRPVLVPVVTTKPDPSNSDSTGEVLPSRVQLFRPGGALPIPLNLAGDAEQIAINDVSRSGTYWIRGLEVGKGFSANLADDAMQLDRIDVAQLDQVFGPDQYGLATSREQIEFTESGAANAVSLHSPAMLLALAIFLLEQILGNRFYRKPAIQIALRT